MLGGVIVGVGGLEGVPEVVAVQVGEGVAPKDSVALDDNEMLGVRDMEGTIVPPLRRGWGGWV